jgi:ubiquinone/menaquinone biosynthesis C-methylase UbiE
MMKSNNEIAEEQAKAWNGPSGRAWVENQQQLDEVFRPFEALLVEPLSATQTRILDVGCGTGATTLAAARRLGSGGQARGIDLSQPMIAMAQDRPRTEGSSARFICANAQEYAFEAGIVDVIMSRFGVMFFASGAAARCAGAVRVCGW